MYFELQQKKSEFFVNVGVPPDIRRGAVNSEFQFLDHKEERIEIEDSGGTEFPDLIIAENYVPMISNKLKRLFDCWGIDNLFYKKLILQMSEYDIQEHYWLALPPRIDCLDPEKSFDSEYSVCNKIIILPNKVGNYDIFKLKDGNDEIIITEKLKMLLEKEISLGTIQGIFIKKI